MDITKNLKDDLYDLMSLTGFELWNASCTHRLRINSDGEWAVHEYHDPLHPIKVFKTLKGAINFMVKKDEE